MKKLLVISLLAILTSCSSVNVTKTAEGYYAPTNPNNIKIFKTVPKTEYIELGTVTAYRFSVSDTAKMHNAIRAKASGLGADSVILTSEGIGDNGMWAMGVAIADVKKDSKK
jgi:hypothetical protein